MKVFNKYILTAAVSLALFSSCKDQLDLYPYSSIETSQAFKTMQDAKSWNNAVYSALRGRVYGNYTIGQDVQADYLNATLDYGNRNGNPHRWGSNFMASDYLLEGVWAGYYFALKDINLMIEKLPGIPTTTTAEATTLKQYIAEAYLARAYYYSELIVRFAKPYEPATASTDPGVPLVVTYDVNLQPSRASVQEVYTQILTDITAAKTALSSGGTPSAVKLNMDAATALEARVKLNMQDWGGAMTASNSLITAGTYPLLTTTSDLTTMWKNDVSSEVIFQISLTQPNELGNTNSIYWGFNAANNKYSPDFLPTQAIMDLYESSDIRKAVYFAQKPVLIQGVDYNLYVVNKYPGNPSLFTSAVTNYQQKPKVFRIAEQYLIYAEAAAKLGGANEANALTKLNALRVARGASSLSGLSGAALMTAVREERTRELAFEGFRLWDLKRWHLGFTRGTPQNLGPIQQGPTFNGLTIAADDNQFTWGIPTNELTTNPNIANSQNPGW